MSKHNTTNTTANDKWFNRVFFATFGSVAAFGIFLIGHTVYAWAQDPDGSIKAENAKKGEANCANVEEVKRNYGKHVWFSYDETTGQAYYGTGLYGKKSCATR
jgi:hypothetical protein